LADEFLPSFLRDEMGLADLHIGLLTTAEADLSHLVPRPRTEYRVVACDDCFALWQPGVLLMLYLLDRKYKCALIWLAAGAAPDWSRPALPIMYAFSVDTSWIALHAAVIGHSDRILLLAGEGRVGKTTAVLACARAGWDYASNDYVYANTTNGQVESLYYSVRLRADVASAFLDLINEATAPGSGPSASRAVCWQRYFCQGAAVRLYRDFLPARRFDALSVFYTSMVFTQLGWADVMIKKITTTLGLVPAFFVDTGQNPDAIPDAFAEFLDHV